MLFYILDSAYNSTGLIDEFATAYWTTRYNEYGEFAIELPCSLEKVTALAMGSFMYLGGEDRYMYISKREQTWTPKHGDTLKVSGYSLERILDRRVIYYEILAEEMPLNQLIKRILDENVINPSNNKRKIPGFTYKETTDSRITSIKITESYVGDNVYTVISTLCKTYAVGFKVTPVVGGGFEFSLYMGDDRSYAQDKNPWIVFSDAMENIGDVTFTENEEKLKNQAWVRNIRDYREADVDEHGIRTGTYTEYSIITEEDVTTKKLTVEPGGLDRREIYVDSSKSNKDEDGNELEEAQYRAILKSEGEEELADYETTAVFAGKVDSGWQHEFNKDFWLGDICQIVSKYGIEQRVRVEEVVRTHDDSGDHMQPSFVNVDEE